jgi:uncharacterized membrane protein
MISLYAMSGLYILAGILHFVIPGFFKSIVPTYIPKQHHMNIVYISGVFEILFGSMVLYEPTRILGAWLLIALLIAVFPANIQMSVTFYQKKNKFFWATVARLPLQFVLIWWAYTFTQ